MSGKLYHCVWEWCVPSKWRRLGMLALTETLSGVEVLLWMSA